MKKRIDTLLFSGGGMKGIAYIGVVKYFEELLRSDKVIFDIETTMTTDKIWCIVCKHKDTYYQFKEDRIHRFEEFLKQWEA